LNAPLALRATAWAPSRCSPGIMVYPIIVHTAYTDTRKRALGIAGRRGRGANGWRRCCFGRGVVTTAHAGNQKPVPAVEEANEWSRVRPAVFISLCDAVAGIDRKRGRSGLAALPHVKTNCKGTRQRTPGKENRCQPWERLKNRATIGEWSFVSLGSARRPQAPVYLKHRFNNS
jgi:hypothetical protein